MDAKKFNKQLKLLLVTLLQNKRRINITMQWGSVMVTSDFGL